MPRAKDKRYKEVSQLPKQAIKVSDYAKQNNIHHSLIYHRLTRKKANYSIVVFQDINFVIPD